MNTIVGPIRSTAAAATTTIVAGHHQRYGGQGSNLLVTARTAGHKQNGNAIEAATFQGIGVGSVRTIGKAVNQFSVQNHHLTLHHRRTVDTRSANLVRESQWTRAPWTCRSFHTDSRWAQWTNWNKPTPAEWSPLRVDSPWRVTWWTMKSFNRISESTNDSIPSKGAREMHGDPKGSQKDSREFIHSNKKRSVYFNNNNKPTISTFVCFQKLISTWFQCCFGFFWIFLDIWMLEELISNDLLKVNLPSSNPAHSAHILTPVWRQISL